MYGQRKLGRRIECCDKEVFEERMEYMNIFFSERRKECIDNFFLEDLL